MRASHCKVRNSHRFDTEVPFAPMRGAQNLYHDRKMRI
jgi:hypothetical protein